MITSFAEKLTDSAIRHGVISEEDRNVYHYGFELMVSTAVHAVIVVIAGIVMKSPMESLLFWWVLAVVRGQTGGYHAETYLKCNIVFALVLTASLWWAKYSAPYYNYAVIIIQFAVYFITVLFLCPVENKNKPLNSEQKKRGRSMSVILGIVVFACSTILYCVKIKNISVLLSSLMLGISVFVIAGYFKESSEQK